MIIDSLNFVSILYRVVVQAILRFLTDGSPCVFCIPLAQVYFPLQIFVFSRTFCHWSTRLTSIPLPHHSSQIQSDMSLPREPICWPDKLLSILAFPQWPVLALSRCYGYHWLFFVNLSLLKSSFRLVPSQSQLRSLRMYARAFKRPRLQ